MPERSEGSGEDWGGAEPLTQQRNGIRCSGGGRVRPKAIPVPLPRGERGVWGRAPLFVAALLMLVTAVNFYANTRPERRICLAG
jgi:hypothetical protein